MSFEEDDKVVLTDKHSEFNGEVGTVTQTMESMFGDVTYTVSFEDGQETGIPEEDLEAADVDEDGDDEDENEAETETEN
ncbi:uncharacterized protein Nmag_0588 [Natrialba magadii ATCC 43099]|uniref:DUF1918 family protein n=1 Tax=Natrialba magadii (strain ATCC 43099 / DSM 3394 / CCM 3739 / CIP 104546 / IAM 13178 / JCM 8861 / NBRC 102185 / NCIMB 2190 / MS3) TaxID=547559 RepID=D3SYR4_NATMM|nr:hypothetical protein [Natrialba magadii]ADD04175.1 uncharacterized protein Nmag_0588 [Natrialba magadii ATCC 43099]ELY32960.1 hypothetical protein C500_03349 [Natrialba magadii ATCC 43099]